MPRQSASYDRAKYIKLYPVGMIAILLLESTRACRKHSPNQGVTQHRCMKAQSCYGTALLKSPAYRKRSKKRSSCLASRGGSTKTFITQGCQFTLSPFFIPPQSQLFGRNLGDKQCRLGQEKKANLAKGDMTNNEFIKFFQLVVFTSLTEALEHKNEFDVLGFSIRQSKERQTSNQNSKEGIYNSHQTQ